MSNVRWCDKGEHPFKAGAPGSQTLTGTEVNENGDTVSITMDVCPEHNTFRHPGQMALTDAPIAPTTPYGTPEQDDEKQRRSASYGL